jgi:hypothetical protein
MYPVEAETMTRRVTTDNRRHPPSASGRPAKQKGTGMIDPGAWRQGLFVLTVVALAVWFAWRGQTCGLAEAVGVGRGRASDWIGPALLALFVGQVVLQLLRWP